MSGKRIDPDQLYFDFDSKVDEIVELKTSILTSSNMPRIHSTRSLDEDCITLAAGLKEAIRESGLSRDQVADEINVLYGWPTSEAFKSLSGEIQKHTQHLSIHMLNHYLSKPSEYKIPGFLIFAIQQVTGSLKACDLIARDQGGQVISSAEKVELTLGKLDTTILEMNRLKRELRGRR
jgi:hypothetical protein